MVEIIKALNEVGDGTKVIILIMTIGALYALTHISYAVMDGIASIFKKK